MITTVTYAYNLALQYVKKYISKTNVRNVLSKKKCIATLISCSITFCACFYVLAEFRIVNCTCDF